MSRTRSEAVADAIAKRIVANTKRRFSSLYADALEELKIMNDKPTVNSAINSATDTASTRVKTGRDVPNGDGLALARAYGQGLPGSPSSDINSGMSVGSQMPTISARPVDANHLEGSNKGDHRSPANKADITAFAKNSPAPRESVGQFKGSKYENQPPFVSTDNAADSDQGN